MFSENNATPFTVIGVSEERGPIKFYDKTTGITTEIGAPGQPMGCCDYCGQGIAIVWRVRGTDGRTFRVGSDCVLKTSKEYGDKDSPLLRAVKKQRRESQLARENARIDAAVQLLHTDVAKALDAMPHPTKWRADKGETALDSALWMFSHAGHAGRLRTARMIEKLTQ